MELRHLRYFVAVASELSFRRAADRLHVVQPALSKQIKNLEEEMRVKLLDRDTTRVQLTDAGRIFLEEVRRILAQVEQASALARETAVGRGGRLTIGNVGPITASFMPACLTKFRMQYPNVAVTLKEIEPADQITELDSGSIQIAFTVEKNPTLPSSLCKTPVLRSAMRVVVGPEHRLAKSRRLSLDEVARETQLCFAGQHSQAHADLVRGIFAAHGLKPKQITTVAGFESLLAMIAGGEGVSLMPQHISLAGAGRIRLIPLREVTDDLVFELSVVWRNREESPLARNFVAMLGGLMTPDQRNAAGKRRGSPEH